MKRSHLLPISALWLLTSGLTPAIIDTNENGLSDLWEKQHNDDELFPETFDPQADPDQDGWTNAEEAAAGTDPFDPNPPGGYLRPEILHTPAVMGEENGQPVIITPEAVTVSWPTLVGKQYTLQLSPDLSENWITIDEPLIGDGDIHEFNFTITGAADQRFWRVAVTDVDSDGDNLTDAEENELGTNPASLDSDGDGLNDSEEVALGTNPNNSDTDGDGMSDGWENEHGLDPNDDGSIESDNGAAGDPDGDGVPNQYDSTPQDADEFVAVILTEGLYHVPFHISYNMVQKRVSLDRLMNASPVAVVDFANGLGTVEIAEVWIEASEPVMVEKRFVLSNLLDLDHPSILEEDYSVEVRPPLLLKIEVGQSESNRLPVKAGVESLNDPPPTMSQAAHIDHMVLEWQPIDGWTNVEDHVHPWEENGMPNVVNGKRIFPCYEDPSKTEIRHKLKLVVKASPLLVGKPVHVKSFDIDDSTSEVFDAEHGGPWIDTNGKSGGDNRQDFLQTDDHGMFWNGSGWGTNIANKQLDNKGRAEFHLRVSMQPGDNYKATASMINASMYSYTQFTNATAPHFIGHHRLENGDAPSSPMLTVWRRLWVENDSMEAIPYDAYGYLRNDLSSDSAAPTVNGLTLNPAATDTVFLIEPINDGSSFLSLEHGRFIVQSVEHSVTGAGFFNDYHAVSVQGDHTTVPLQSEYRLYDDDGMGIVGGPLPCNNLVDEFMKGLFLTSFIDLRDSGNFNTRKTVPFRRNDDLQLNTVVNDSKDLSEQHALWVAQVTAAYQFDMNEDGDPNSEERTDGGTRQFQNYDHSTVFLECCREAYRSTFIAVEEEGGNPQLAVQAREKLEFFIKATASHEIGHMPGIKSGDDEHAEMGLMRDGGVSPSYPHDEAFSPASVNRFRSSQNWSKK